MTTLNTNPAGASAVPSLTSEEFAEASLIASRIREEVRNLLAALPAEARSASGMARHLRIERTVCQRLISGIESDPSGPGTLTDIPGPTALGNLIAALRKKRIDDAAVRRLAAAIDVYAEFLVRIGGNQRTLSRRLLVTRPQLAAKRAADIADFGPEGESSESVRHRLFAAARELLGISSQVEVMAQIISMTGRPERVQYAGVDGSIGYRARPGSPPYVLNRRTASAGTEFTSPDHTEDAVLGNGRSLLKRFSSQPLPRLTTVARNGELAQLIDHQPGHSFDAVFCGGAITDEPHPREQTPPIQEIWALMNTPTQALIFDVFLHKSLAIHCIPGVDVHQWRLNVASTTDRWSSRVEGGPRLQILGTGLSQSDSDLYPRHRELLTELFRLSGHNPDDFVGHRCEVRYPAWRLGYRMFFDFTPSLPTT